MIDSQTRTHSAPQKHLLKKPRFPSLGKREEGVYRNRAVAKQEKRRNRTEEERTEEERTEEDRTGEDRARHGRAG